MGAIRGPGLRGTMIPFSSKKNVWPVTISGPMHTPNSILGICFLEASEVTANLRRLSSGDRTMQQPPNGKGMF